MNNYDYNFGQYDESLKAYVKKLIDNSGEYFCMQAENGEVVDRQHDADVVADCFRYLVDYLQYNYQESPETFDEFMAPIIERVQTVAVLPVGDDRRIFGRIRAHKNVVEVNPDLPASMYLTDKERTRLYFAHELGHVTNSAWTSKALDYVNYQIYRRQLSLEDAQLIFDGVLMLDEAIAQNRAEEYTYDYSGKQRPKQRMHTIMGLYRGMPFKSNFDYYCELQEPAVMFARTLRGIGGVYDDSAALDILSERAMSPDFFDNILEEYQRSGQMEAFKKIFISMGYLKRASYANFGCEDPRYMENSWRYLDDLRNQTAALRDYRDPFDDMFFH